MRCSEAARFGRERLLAMASPAVRQPAGHSLALSPRLAIGRETAPPRCMNETIAALVRRHDPDGS